MQNITTRELKHLCNFLTHEMNYKVELVTDEDLLKKIGRLQLLLQLQ